MESTSALNVVRQYFDALAAKDFGAVAALWAADIVWHQPGHNQFSGTHNGAGSVGETIGGMMTVSQGSFDLTLVGSPMANGNLVAAPVHFAAQREGSSMSMDGVDLLRIDGGQIAEVFLFSADEQAEDAFWGQG